MSMPTGKPTRAEHLAQPLARVVAEQVATDHGGVYPPGGPAAYRHRHRGDRSH